MSCPALRVPLGELVITANASLRLSTEEVLMGLRRHASGDWGDLCPEDTMANDESLDQGGRLLSAYGDGSIGFGSSPKPTAPLPPSCCPKITDGAASPDVLGPAPCFRQSAAACSSGGRKPPAGACKLPRPLSLKEAFGLSLARSLSPPALGGLVATPERPHGAARN